MQNVWTFSKVSEKRRTRTSVMASNPVASGGNEIDPACTTISNHALAANTAGIRSGRFESFAWM